MLGSGDDMSGLVVEALTVRYYAGGSDAVAVDQVDLHVPPRTTVGLVGESGSGKSSLAKAIVGLVPHEHGRLTLDGTALRSGTLRERRRLGRRIQMIFQDPDTALDPRMTVGQTLGEAVIAFQRLDRSARMARTEEWLETVGLTAAYCDRLPRELSGGQRQRVAIARALAVQPSMIIADEVTSALDTSVQASVLNMLRDLRERLGLSMLFVGHNLAAVRYVSDLIAVMYQGRIIEVGPTDQVLTQPRHEYTQRLLAAVPTLEGPPAPVTGPFREAAAGQGHPQTSA